MLPCPSRRHHPLLDGQGNCVVEYTYDAWGKVLSKTGSMAGTLGNDNPLRYRGYYYDQETGFYYLQSRYYDPATGRFINADDVSFLGASGTALSYNLFAYCENNPMNNIDLNGYLAFSQTKTYYIISFNNWETNMLIGAITLGIEAVGVILAIIAAVPTFGISTAIGKVICSAGGFFFSVMKLMNLAGGNKGLNVHLRKPQYWYLINYFGINKVEPKGFQNIWEVFESVKKYVKQIISKIGVAAIKRLSQKSKTNRVSVLAKMLYDYYCGKSVVKKNYRIS